MELTTEQIDTLWDDNQAVRTDMSKRSNYYEGKHDICGKNLEYSGGGAKSERVTNWIRTIIDRHVGALTDMPWQVTKRDMGGGPVGAEGVDDGTDGTSEPEAVDASGVELYADIARDQGLDATDGDLLHDALLYGVGVEVHSFDSTADQKIQITRYDPRDWVMVYDGDGGLCAAINRVTLASGTVYEDKVLDGELELQTVYTDATIAQYSRAKDKEGKRSGWELKNNGPHPHFYGAVPVVDWTVTHDGDSFISDALLGQNNEYNEIDSTSGDQIRLEASALLKTWGIDPSWIKEHAQDIKDLGILPFGDKSTEDAGYIERRFDTERVESRLERTRQHIHAMGAIPDVQQIVGTSGATSGIALKLMFTPMQQTAGRFIARIRQCLRKRIDLINAMAGKASATAIANYNTVVAFSIPVNNIETWQHIGALEGLVSNRTRLELLPDIDDPERELRLLAEETPVEPLPDMESDTVRMAKEKQIDAASASLEPMAETLMTQIGEQVAQAIEALVLRQTPAPVKANGDDTA